MDVKNHFRKVFPEPIRYACVHVTCAGPVSEFQHFPGFVDAQVDDDIDSARFQQVEIVLPIVVHINGPFEKIIVEIVVGQKRVFEKGIASIQKGEPPETFAVLRDLAQGCSPYVMCADR
jgi:hypothetical protein